MSDLVNKKMIWKQDLECATTRLSETSHMDVFSPVVGSGIDVMSRSKEDCVPVPPDHSQASCIEPSTHKTLLWDSFQRLSGIGILHETLPEVGRLSLNSSTSSETSFNLEPKSYVHSDAFADDVGKGQAIPELDSNLQARLTSYEALKKSLSKIREESYLSNPKTLEQHKVELSSVAKAVQADDAHTVWDTQDLFIDYAKPSSLVPLDGKTQTVSLTKAFLVEQKLKTTVPCSLGEFLPSLKEEEISSKSLEARDSLI